MMEEALVATFEPEGLLLSLDRRCQEITGLSGEELTRRSWFEVFVTPAERDAVRAQCRRLRAAGDQGIHEGPIVAADGREHRIRWHMTPVAGRNGPVICALGIDLTGQRRAAARAQRTDRMALLRTMTARLAHEVRNPLNAAQLQLSLLERRLAQPAPDTGGALAAAALVGRELCRLGAVTQELLDFFQPQALRLAPMGLRDVVDEVLGALEPEASAIGAAMVLAPGPNVSLRADGGRLRQVLLNLVRNALEAAGRGGHVDVKVRRRDGHALVEVQDDGPGLPAPDAPIFEAFFTTKPDGTGLGLAIAHRIVADHDGEIAAERRGDRTVFTVALPR